MGDEQLELPQLLVVLNTQAPLVHTPSQTVKVFVVPPTWQSAGLLGQQLALGMQAEPQSLKPLAQPQTPAPEQVKLVPHGVEALPPQVPLEQVPVLSVLLLLAGSHESVPQVPMAATHLPAVHLPLQSILLTPRQSLSLQQLPDGMQPPLQDVKPAAQVEHCPCPEQVNPVAHGVVAPGTQVPFEQLPTAMLLVPLAEQVAVPQVAVGYIHEWVVALQLVAAHWANVEGHSLTVQQFPFPTGIQTPEHSSNPAAQVVLHRPAPAQVKFPPHETALGTTQAPLEQVPAPTWLAPEQVGVLHPPAVV